MNCWQGALPFNWMDSDGSGFVQALGNDYIAEGAIQPRHLDHVKALVSPVNISYKKNRNVNQLSSPLYVLVQLCTSELK